MKEGSISVSKEALLSLLGSCIECISHALELEEAVICLREEISDLKDSEQECEPDYEAEDIGCQCIKGGVESEWQWVLDIGCYVCQGCGAV